MKAFLQHDDSGLFYQHDGRWVQDPVYALAFVSAHDAEQFRHSRRIESAHAVMRIDPQLFMRLSTRPPGVYQMGE